MREKIKDFFEKLSDKVTSSPAYAKALRVRDKIAACILKGLLAFLNAIGPVWNFFCLKTQDGPQITESS